MTGGAGGAGGAGGVGAWMRGHARKRPRKGRPLDPWHASSVWHERELLGGEHVDAVVGVLRTSGCSHDREAGGCTMCGYGADTPVVPPTTEQLLAQVREVASQRRGAPWVKLYTSGSMLDPREVPEAVQDAILAAFGDARRLTVESRAEHVTPDRVRHLAGGGNLEVAIGLESACDAVLEGAIAKGMTIADFRRAAADVRAGGAMLRAYVLLKPPLLTEAEALADTVEAAQVALAAGARTVSINPVNVQAGTLVDHLHRRGEYEPPWLWTVVEALRRAHALAPEGAQVLSSPTAGGTPRGAHNCGRCDKAVLAAIERHRLEGDARALDVAPRCGCEGMWRAQLLLEGLEQGPFAPRGYRRDMG